MTDIYLKAIFHMLFVLAANSGSRSEALRVQQALLEEIKEYEKRQSELADTNLGGSSRRERSEGGDAVRREIGTGVVQDAKRSGGIGI